MSQETEKAVWDPTSQAVRDNQIAAYDAMRERLTLMWAAANRDQAVFGDSDAYDPVRNKANNLLYGAGLHVCPGERLARLELRLIMEAILGDTQEITLASRTSPERAVFPGSGFSSLSVHFR